MLRCHWNRDAYIIVWMFKIYLNFWIKLSPVKDDVELDWNISFNLKFKFYFFLLQKFLNFLLMVSGHTYYGWLWTKLNWMCGCLFDCVIKLHILESEWLISRVIEKCCQKLWDLNDSLYQKFFTSATLSPFLFVFIRNQFVQM